MSYEDEQADADNNHGQSRTLADILYSHVYNTQDTANMHKSFLLSFSINDVIYSFSTYDMQNNDDEARCYELSVNGKVHGIKLLRGLFGCGLKEAKDLWEANMPSHGYDDGMHHFNVHIEGESHALEIFSKLVKHATASQEASYSIRQMLQMSAHVSRITLIPFTNNYFTL